MRQCVRDDDSPAKRSADEQPLAGEPAREREPEREWRIKMAHNLAPSVNCSLDDIDLNALKVH